MNAKFTYVGIRVKSLKKSVDFYTRFLGMKDLGRSTIEATKGETASLESSDGRFALELNYYPRRSQEAGSSSRQ